MMPLPLFGSTLIIYLGFQYSTAYARGWEARGLTPTPTRL
jgi:predicted membrane chloride channel (bestrophin family)